MVICRRRRCIGWTAAVLAVGVAGGCRQKDDAPEIVSLNGKVEKIDVASGLITARYYNAKRDAEIVGTGQVTAETEILINGVASRLADLRVGDRIRGEIRIVNNGEEIRRLVLKIHVDRPKHDAGNGG